MKKIILLLLVMIVVASCSSKKIDRGIKSPCVSIDSKKGNPCGDRRPVNFNIS